MFIRRIRARFSERTFNKDYSACSRLIPSLRVRFANAKQNKVNSADSGRDSAYLCEIERTLFQIRLIQAIRGHLAQI